MEEELKDILDLMSENGIEGQIKEDLEDFNTMDEAIGYLKDVCQYGGQSGCISGLIYYVDTNKFYDDHEKEIEDILEEFKDNCGYKNRAEAISNLNGSAESITQEKNLLSWMAYEEKARNILREYFNTDY